MSIGSMDELDPVQIDVLKEIGNIGHGNAATALSQMLGRPIDIDVPDVRLLDMGETVEYLGGPENMILGMIIELGGDVCGMMLYALQESFAAEMISAVFGRKPDSLTDLDEMELSFIKEIGNILAGSYVNALSALTGLTTNISVPTVTVDMAGAILSVPAVEFARQGSKVLFIDDRFKLAGGDGEIKSNMILIPELSSLERIFGQLGVDM